MDAAEASAGHRSEAHSDTAVEITPKEPLAPGQYVLGGPPTIAIYDFGVEENKTN